MPRYLFTGMCQWLSLPLIIYIFKKGGGYMTGDAYMYASKAEASLRAAMLSLEGDIGEKVFSIIRSSKKNNKSEVASKEVKKKIEAALRNDETAK